MRVLVEETAMLVRMAVRFAVWIGRCMRMPMMRVVDMPVLVKERFVHMLVLMFFGKMQIHARRHERGSRDQRPCDGFAEQRNRDRGADKGSDRKIRPGPGRTEMTQSQYEGRKAHAITEETDDSGRGKGPSSGKCAPWAKPSAVLMTPAATPLTMAIWSGSAALSFRVRLLSIPQCR